MHKSFFFFFFLFFLWWLKINWYADDWYVILLLANNSSWWVLQLWNPQNFTLLWHVSLKYDHTDARFHADNHALVVGFYLPFSFPTICLSFSHFCSSCIQAVDFAGFQSSWVGTIINVWLCDRNNICYPDCKISAVSICFQLNLFLFVPN